MDNSVIRYRSARQRFSLLAGATLAIALSLTLWLIAAPIIDTSRVTPSEVVVNTAATVSVTALITDTTLTATSVNVLETDLAGRTLRTLGVMRDDGGGGDQVANDRIFTFSVPFNEAAAGARHFRVSAAFRGVILRVLSPVMTVTIRAATVPVSLTPNPLSIVAGAQSVLTATLAPAPIAGGTLQLSVDDTSIALVPSSVAFESGQTQVEVPIVAAGEGTTAVRAQLNGGSASATIQVRPGVPRVVSLLPPALALTVGASGNLTVRLSAAPAIDTDVELASSQPTIAAVPGFVTVPAGSTEAQVPVSGIASGDSQVTARLEGSSATSQVSVTPAPPTLVSLLPPTSSLVLGASGQLRVTISSAQGTPTVVGLTTSPEAVLSVPDSVVVPPGEVSVSFNVLASGLGQGGVTATLNGSAVSALVTVNPPAVEVIALEPQSAQISVGASAGFVVRINAAQLLATEISLESSSPAVLEVPATVTIQAGSITAEFVGTARALGDALLTASVNGTARQSSVRVVPQAVSLVSLVPDPLPLQQGATGLLTINISSVQEAPAVVTLSNSSPSTVQLPENVTVPSGVLFTTIPVNALAAGRATVTASANGSSAAATVIVSLPPAIVTSLEPVTVLAPKGTPATLRVTISRGLLEPVRVAVSSGDDSVAAAPAEVTVPAGALFTDFPVATLGAGVTTISASLNGGGASAQVTVTAAEPVSLMLVPTTPIVSIGETVTFKAVATLTDGTNGDVTASAAWTSMSPLVASIDVSGVATALAVGETSVGAALTFTPVLTGVPATLLASTVLTVVDSPTLQLSAPSPETAVGDSVVLTLSASVAAPAGGLVVSLSAAGTGGVSLPASVTIAEASSSVQFTLTGAQAGTVDVTATTAGYVPSTLALLIHPPVRIDSINPTSGPVGGSVELTGGGFNLSAGANVVRFPSAENTTVNAQVMSATATRLVVRVPPLAENGPIAVSNGRGSASSQTFTVVRERDYQLVASPAISTVYRGASNSVQVQLGATGTAPFTALVNLAVEGLPDGVTAQFLPAPAITGNQTVVLELSASGAAAIGSHPLVVRGELSESGQPLVRKAILDLIVQSTSGVTGVKGRFITPERIGIAGVIARVDGPNGPIQTTTDAAGNFQLVGLPAGETSVRFDATPANPLYPIWPYTTTLLADQVQVFPDWTINPPPPIERFTPIANTAQDQVITDPRFPGLAIRLPRGVTITGWDGVLKTRIAVERVEISKLPVPPPPTPTGAAYQLYFGTPMGGIPSAPIPVTLPNDVAGEPGEAVDVWYFDGSPMARSGEWKIAGQAIVSADGKSATMLPGTGVPRFCGVCGLVCLGKQPPAPEPPPLSCKAGNPVELFTGQEMPATTGLSCGGLTPIDTGLTYNPVDAFDGIGGVSASLGYGWTLDYDIAFLPFVGPQKRLVLPGNDRVNFVDDGTGSYRSFDDPRFDGSVIRATNLAAQEWELTFRDQSKWRFKPFATVFQRGGPPTFVTEMLDPQGNVLPIQRQSNGRISSIGTQDRGVTMTYGGNGFVSQVRDTENRTIQYAYNSDNRIERVTDPDGRETRYDYVGDDEFPVLPVCPAQPAGGERLRTILYPGRPNPTRNDYGPGRRVLRQVGYDGLEHRFAYRVTGACVVHVSNPATVCKGLQCPNVDSWENFQAGWRLYGGAVVATTVTKPDGNKYTNEFNPQGMTVARTDAQGQRSSFKLDTANRMVERTDQIGRVWKYEYDASGNTTSQTDPLGRVTRYTYDPKWNQVTSVTKFDEANNPQTWRFTYDAHNGALLSAVNPLNDTTRFENTTRGEPETIASATNQLSQLIYSSDGDIDGFVDPLGHVTRFLNDRAGRRIGRSLPLGQTSSVSFNASGAITSLRDELGYNTQLTYDQSGRLSVVRNASGVAIETLEYDTAGRIATKADAAGRRTRYEYDSVGRQVATVNRRGLITTYEYDRQSRLSRVHRPEGDVILLRDSVGRIIEMSEGTAVVSYNYDMADRIVTEVQTSQALRIQLDFRYDALGRRISRDIAGMPNESTRYVYDLDNRLTDIAYRSGTTSFSYDPSGRLVAKTLPNRIRQAYTYDEVGQISSIVSSDASGVTAHSVAYRYDDNGRLVAQVINGSVLSDDEFEATYSNDDRMTSYTLIKTGQTFGLEYDEDGNLTRKYEVGSIANTVRYSWDSENRLVGASGPSTSASYDYDPVGRRIGASINSANVSYIYDGLQAIGEIGLSEISNVVGDDLDEMIARYGPRGASYFVTDGLGSVVAQTRSDAVTSVRYTYSPYGRVEMSGSDDSPIQFTGREIDANGLYFFRARYYDYVMKRFISEDPLGLSAGVNKFSYANASPIDTTDPTGERFLADVGRGVGSYFSGLYGTARFSARRWGLLGDYEQCRANAENEVFKRLLATVWDHPDWAWRGLREAVVRRPGLFVGRQTTAVAVGVLLKPAGAALAILSTHGSIRNAIERGADMQEAIEAAFGGEYRIPDALRVPLDRCSCP